MHRLGVTPRLLVVRQACLWDGCTDSVPLQMAFASAGTIARPSSLSSNSKGETMHPEKANQQCSPASKALSSRSSSEYRLNDLSAPRYLLFACRTAISVGCEPLLPTADVSRSPISSTPSFLGLLRIQPMPGQCFSELRQQRFPELPACFP